MKGGYMLVDCKGLSIDSESAVTVKGIFKAVSTALKRNKAVMLCNLRKSDGASGTYPVTPVFAAVSETATESGGAIVLTVDFSIPGYGLDSAIHFSLSGDSVTITKTGTDEET